MPLWLFSLNKSKEKKAGNLNQNIGGGNGQLKDLEKKKLNDITYDGGHNSSRHHDVSKEKMQEIKVKEKVSVEAVSDSQKGFSGPNPYIKN